MKDTHVTWRTIRLIVGYPDDPHNPRQIDLRGELNALEDRWTKHLNSQVTITIERDFIA